VGDAKIVMNPGVGGDTMDASQATQLDGTVVKRERVVLGNDLGGLVGETHDATVVEVLEEIRNEIRTIRMLMEEAL